MINSTLRFLSKRKTGVFITQLLVIAFLFASLVSISPDKSAHASSFGHYTGIETDCNLPSTSQLWWDGYPSGTYGKVVGNLWASTNIYTSWYIYQGGQKDMAAASTFINVNNYPTRTNQYFQQIGDYYFSSLPGGHGSEYSNTVYC